ncbi:nucleotidyltransferase, partial [candidate division GN15 bacterium]|nr:nucleotidyltransferase [candidate division GN15 bacterium]
VVALLKQHGLTDITSLLYFQSDVIRNYFKDGAEFGVTMNYAQPEDDLGTAGAVRHAVRDPDEPVLVISGDVICTFDLTQAIEWHKAAKADATIVLTRIENPIAYGIVITDDDGNIVRFLEKPSWGEAFSDTINTGVYILEPRALKMIPEGENFDFSQDLYPKMLQEKMKLCGHILDGYWRDVGNVDEYFRVHRHIFGQQIDLNMKIAPTRLDNGVLYKGANVELADDVKLSGMVILGDDARVESGAELENCAIGPRSRVGAECDIKNTIIWADTAIGAGSEISAAIICAGCRFGDKVQVMDNAIVSDDCTVGNDATIRANCKIWPGKTVDEGAIVSSSLVWGEKWNRELATESKVTGLALTEITPEMAVRLGAAFGATLGKGAAVVTSRDASDVTRLLRRSLMSGLLASGVHVSDLETMPVPVVRYALGKGTYGAGIYVRHNPTDYRQLDFIFFHGSGLDMPTAKLKKLERNYFGEDFERASLDDIGHLDYPQRVLLDYQGEFMGAIDADLLHRAGFKVVVDYSNGSASEVFPTLFTKLGISATELNANPNPRKCAVTPEEHAQQITQLSAIVRSINADIGVLINPAAEKLTLVDEQGVPLDNQTLLLMVTDLFLRTHSARSIAVPVAASMGIEEIAEEHGVTVSRVGNDHQAMMQARRSEKVDFVGGTRGGFIFPGFQTGSDAILGTVHILEMMATTRERMSSLRMKFDGFARQDVSVPCPWSKKGQVMRRLITESADKNRQLVDGVRIFDDGGWVLVVPDRWKASFNILAESRSVDHTTTLVERYRELVEAWQKN